MSANNTPTSTFYDLTTNGVGYMSRLRLVRPDKSKGQQFKPFWSVSISALCGEADAVKYVKYDLSIKGDQAKQAMEVLKPFLVDEHGKALNNKVIVGFQLGDALPEVYFVTKDGKEEARVSLKGRLLKIRSAKVNGEAIQLPMTEHDQTKAAAANEQDSQAAA